MPRVARTGAAALAVSVSAALLPAPAFAESGSWGDPAGDMVREEQPAPEHEIGDLRRLKVNHADRAVLLRAPLTELARRGRCISLAGEIRTDADPEGGPEGFYVQAGRGCEDPGGDGWRCGGEMDSYFGTGFTCHFDYADDVIRVRVPRVALDAPGWVQVSARTRHVSAAGDYFSDHLDRGWTPRLRRG